MGDAGRGGYDRIGGEGALLDVVDDFYERLLADPRLPAEASTRDSHRGIGDLVTAHLDDALHAAGVPEPTVEEIISVVAPLAPELVTQPLTS